MNRYITASMITCFLFATGVFGADHYVSAEGSYSWENSKNTSTPCSITTAFANATAGDTVLLFNGNYIIRSLTTSRNGNSDSNRVIIKNYPDHRPILIASSSERNNCINIWNDYWTFDGLTVKATLNSTESGIFSNYEKPGIKGIKILNCYIEVLSDSSGNSNAHAIYLHSVSNSLIQNNEIVCHNTAQNRPGGIQLWRGIGNKILNNIIHGGGMGVYQKWPNCDISLSSGAEVAYNYIYNVGSGGGIEGRWSYTYIHDNIVVSSAGSTGRIIQWTNGGLGCTSSDGTVGSVWNHNTFIGNMYVDSDSGWEGTFKNNIISSYELYAKAGSWNNNIITLKAGRGEGDQGYKKITFVGGAYPSTISGFTVAVNSAGYKEGDDGADIGANVTKVGNNNGLEEITRPMAPENLSIIQK